jgi:membrane-associated phospholipid phosphatase
VTALPERPSGTDAPSAATRVLTTWSGSARDLGRRWRRATPRAQARTIRHVEASFALLICVAVLALAILGDETIARRAQTISPGIKSIFGQVTKLGLSGWIFIVCALVAGGALALAGRMRPRVDAGLQLLAGRATFIFSTNAIAGLLAQLPKHLAGRARPKYLDAVGPFHFDMFALKGDFASFPSGHSVTAFASVVALAYFLPRWRWPLLALGCLVGLSRIIIGAHYPSDVLAGAAIGWTVTLFLARACAARHIVFRQVPSGGIRPRGMGLVWPSVTAVLRPAQA